MSVTFFVSNHADNGFLRLPGPLAGHLLIALGYKLQDVVNRRELVPADLMHRLLAMRRQFALGRGREFTSVAADERQMLLHLEELEKMVERAEEMGTNIVLM